MKKKLITMLLALTLTASMLAGCGGDKEEEAAAPEQTEEAAEEEAEEVEEAAEEETAEVAEEPAEEPAEEAAEESSSDSGSFTLLDVDENMIDVGAYGMSSEGLEVVFSMFTGPDSNKYVALFGFDNNSGGGNVICGQYDVSTETDEDGDTWTYFDVKDVYSGNNYQLGVCERESGEIYFFDENAEVIEGKYLSNSETIDYMGSAAGILMSGDSESAE